jgi:periplasmic divalent cation tolerance protein
VASAQSRARYTPRSLPAIQEGTMVTGKDSRIVLVTCGSILEARRVANRVVKKRLAACVSIILSPVQSIYRWKGKVASAREVLILIKTNQKRLAELEKAVRHLHSYEVPEFIALPISSGSREYLAWVQDSVKAS